MVFFLLSYTLLLAQAGAPQLGAFSPEPAQSLVQPPQGASPASSVSFGPTSPNLINPGVSRIDKDKVSDKGSEAPARTDLIKPDPFASPVIQNITARYEQAVGGKTSWDDLKTLAADLGKMEKLDPGDHLVQAYLGCTETLLSRDAFPGPSKYIYLRDGFADIEAAVQAEPENPAVRLMRAVDYLNLPYFFGRRATAEKDLSWLEEQIESAKAKCLYRLETSTQQAIYYYNGLSLRQQAQRERAIEAWEAGVKLAPASDVAQKIRKELSRVVN